MPDPNALPSLPADDAVQTPIDTPAENPATPKKPKSKKSRTKTIATKVADLQIDAPVLVSEMTPKSAAAYRSRTPRIDSKRLTSNQATAAKALLAGLVHSGAKLENGKVVKDKRDIVGYLLDQVHKGMVAEKLA